MPAACSHRPRPGIVGRDGAEGLECPLRCLLGGFGAEVRLPLVGGRGEVGQVLLPGGVVDGWDPVGVGVPDRFEPLVRGRLFGDAVVQDVGEAAGVVQVAEGDGVGEDLVGVVAGELGAAQRAGEGGMPSSAAMVRRCPSVRRPGVDEAVQPGGGPAGGGEFGDVGEPLAGGPERRRSRRRWPRPRRWRPGRQSAVSNAAPRTARASRCSTWLVTPTGASSGMARVVT